MTAVYSLRVEPAEALLGEPVTLLLACAAEGDAPASYTFEHGSLTVELARVGAAGEPAYAFPNRRVLHEGGLLIRESPLGGVEDLAAGETRTRALGGAALFPLQLLAPGEFAWRYALGPGGVAQAGARAVVVSGPGAVVALLDRLEVESVGAVRARIAELLRRMTAQGADYDAEADAAARAEGIARWRAFWAETGQHLPWDPSTEGARAGVLTATMAPRAYALGGVVYPPGTDLAAP